MELNDTIVIHTRADLRNLQNTNFLSYCLSLCTLLLPTLLDTIIVLGVVAVYCEKYAKFSVIFINMVLTEKMLG